MKNNKEPISYIWVWLALWVCFWAVLGSIFDDLSTWVGIWICFGLCIGVIVDEKTKKDIWKK